MAQMTQNASVGPVLVISAHINPHHSIKLYIEPKNDQLVHKKRDIKENMYQGPKRCVQVLSRLGPFSSSPPTETFVAVLDDI